MIDFWTYSCINCLRSIPYVKAWDERYRKDGLVVIGVHAPEFAFEREPANVAQAMKDLGIRYPVALDNNYVLWRALQNNYWPAHYFVDAQGRIRYHHFGEGDYDGLGAGDPSVARRGRATHRRVSRWPQCGYRREAAAAMLRRSARPKPTSAMREPTASFRPADSSRQAEDLCGQRRFAQRMVASKGHGRTAGRALARWRRSADQLPLPRARPAPRARPRNWASRSGFKVTLDGKAPGNDAGVDVKAAGMGVVKEQRLYQLVRQNGPVRDRTFTIEFLDPRAEAFSFTFG